MQSGPLVLTIDEEPRILQRAEEISQYLLTSVGEPYLNTIWKQLIQFDWIWSNSIWYMLLLFLIDVQLQIDNDHVKLIEIAKHDITLLRNCYELEIMRSYVDTIWNLMSYATIRSNYIMMTIWSYYPHDHFFTCLCDHLIKRPSQLAKQIFETNFNRIRFDTNQINM